MSKIQSLSYFQIIKSLSALFVVFFITSCSSPNEIDPLDENLSIDSETTIDDLDDLEFSDLDSSEEFDLDSVDDSELEEGFEDTVAEDSAGSDDFGGFGEDFEEGFGEDDFSFEDEGGDFSFDEESDSSLELSEDELDDFEDVGGDDISFDDFASNDSDSQADNTADTSDELSFDDFSFEEDDAGSSSVSEEGSSDELITQDESIEIDPNANSIEEEDTFSLGPPSDEPFDIEDNTARNKVLSVDYLSQLKGGSFQIKMSQTPDYDTEYIPDTNQFVLNLYNSDISKDLKRPFLTKDFQQNFKSMSSYQDKSGSVKFVFKLWEEPNSTRPNVRMEGNTLQVARSQDNILAQNNAYGNSGNGQKWNQSGSSQQESKNQLKNGMTSNDTIAGFMLNNENFSGSPISIQAKDEDIVNIINFISEEVGANIIVSDSVDGTISLKLNEVPWDQALSVIMKSKGLGYVRSGNILRVSTLEELKKEALAAAEIQKSQQSRAPFHVKVFPLSYAKPETITEKVKPFLTGAETTEDNQAQKGQVIAEERSSSLIVRDKLEVLRSVEELIEELDRPPLQVMIKAKIVEASKNFTREIGATFGGSFDSQNGGGSGSLAARGNLNFSGGLTGSLSASGIDFLGNLTQTLRLSEMESQAKVLSSPSVIALNNEKAVILQSDEVLTPQITQNTGVNTTTTFSRDPVELRLEVTPQVSMDGNVIMELLVRRQTPGQPVQNTRPIATREAETKVIVGNNKTAMIGGVYQAVENQIEEGTPVLRNVPLLKWLFSSKELEKIDTELVIFITPKVLQDKIKRKNDVLEAQESLPAESKISLAD